VYSAKDSEFEWPHITLHVRTCQL